MLRERISWIDIARGIGILAVIYAHGLDGHSIRYLFYAFHIPLFFFLSGVVFHHKNHESFYSIVRSAVKNILIPYFLFATLSYSFWLITTNFSQFSIENLPKTLFNILYGNGNQKQFFYNAVLWFLPCLFITRILFGILTMISTKRIFLALALFVFSVGGYAVSLFSPKLTLPFGFEAALTGVVFFGIGFLFHSLLPHVKHLLEKHRMVIFATGLSVCILVATVNFTLSGHQIDMRLNRLDNYFLFYLAALSGIAMSIAGSFLIRHNSLLEYIGQQSMPLFIWHLIIFSLFSKFLMQFITPHMVTTLRNLYLAPLYTILSIGVISLCSYLYPRVKKQILLTTK